MSATHGRPHETALYRSRGAIYPALAIMRQRTGRGRYATLQMRLPADWPAFATHSHSTDSPWLAGSHFHTRRASQAASKRSGVGTDPTTGRCSPGRRALPPAWRALSSACPAGVPSHRRALPAGVPCPAGVPSRPACPAGVPSRPACLAGVDVQNRFFTVLEGRLREVFKGKALIFSEKCKKPQIFRRLRRASGASRHPHSLISDGCQC